MKKKFLKLNPKFWFANDEIIDIEIIKRNNPDKITQELAIYDYYINKYKNDVNKEKLNIFQRNKIDYMIKHNLMSEYDGEISRLSMEFPSESEKELDNYKLRKLDIELKYKNIDELNYDLEKTKIIEKDGFVFEKKKLDILYKHQKMEYIEYIKQKATLNGEPFVAVKPNFENTTGDEFSIEIECNDIFLEKLKKQGYNGDTKDDLLEEWLRYKVAYSFEGLDEILNNNTIPTKNQKYVIDEKTNKKLYR